ncbi:MAG: MATE family efflux transporter, partial [Bacillota bacterium]|nr:MATE family efflux transporter [Bacillota bacterium]
VLYARILLASMPAFILQMAFQILLVTAEKPQLGLFFTVGASVTNIILDFLFIVVFHWGLAGAALATAAGEIFGGVGPLVYFLRKNSSLLRLTKTKFEGRVLTRTCINGSSEMMSNLAASIVNMLYNLQLLKHIGEDGVAAYGVIMYINFIFTGIFFGYSMGSGPIVSYHYGAQNHVELKNLFLKSLTLMGIAGLCLTALAVLLANPLVRIFVGYDQGLLELTSHGFRLYALAFLFMGFNIYGSAFFTALNNGPVSAAISFSRTLVFETSAVLILPLLLGINGIWLAVVIADILSLVVTSTFLIKFRSRYHYV